MSAQAPALIQATQGLCPWNRSPHGGRASLPRESRPDAEGPRRSSLALSFPARGSSPRSRSSERQQVEAAEVTSPTSLRQPPPPPHRTRSLTGCVRGGCPARYLSGRRHVAERRPGLRLRRRWPLPADYNSREAAGGTSPPPGRWPGAALWAAGRARCPQRGAESREAAWESAVVKTETLKRDFGEKSPFSPPAAGLGRFPLRGVCFWYPQGRLPVRNC